MDDDFDWDRSEMDLDITGDPQLDQFGYQSPRRNFTPAREGGRDWLAQAKRDRAERQQRRQAAVEQNLAETRRRVAERRGQPQPVTPALAPHVAQAVAHGMPGRSLGWWRVDVAPDGTAWWTRVDAPGADGPQITVEQPQPTEQTEPSPGTQMW
jgi:hypothetical protein